MKDIEEDENYNYLTLFYSHTEGEVVLITPRSTLRIRVGRGEFSWDDFRFESKTQSKQSIRSLVPDDVGIPDVSKKLNKVGVEMILTCVRLCSLTRHHHHLELLVLNEALRRTLPAGLGEIALALEDVA